MCVQIFLSFIHSLYFSLTIEFANVSLASDDKLNSKTCYFYANKLSLLLASLIQWLQQCLQSLALESCSESSQDILPWSDIECVGLSVSSWAFHLNGVMINIQHFLIFLKTTSTYS